MECAFVKLNKDFKQSQFKQTQFKQTTIKQPREKSVISTFAFQKLS